MDQPNVMLWDVPEPIRTACEKAASDWGAQVAAAHGEIPVLSGSAGVRLVVVGECRAGSLRNRLLTARNHFRNALVVAMLPRSALHGVAKITDLSRVAVAEERDDPAADAADLLEASAMGPPPVHANLVGVSLATALLRARLAAAAASDANVLLLGETGTGKSAAARVIHGWSRRARAPFVQVDCAALSPTVVESELFGHERGAFTGAVGRRAGRFESAAHGTLFLDEIGEIPGHLQTKFLRVLEEREFERVGSCTPQSMRARVIAATHVDLAKAVREKSFRADLYYRLRVFSLHLPPLRERPADIVALVQHMLPRLCERLARPVSQIAPCFIERLLEHSWPGNVRELLHTLEGVLVQSGPGAHRVGSLDRILGEVPLPGVEAETVTVGGMLKVPPGFEQEQSELAEVLMATGGNVARVARRLGIPRSTARYRIRRLGLSDVIPRD